MSERIDSASRPVATSPAADDYLALDGQTNATRKITATNFKTITATGTTAGRTLEARFADVVNVKDFGALGDGSTNDRAAFAAALAAADTVFVPGGGRTYVVDSSFSLAEGQRLISDAGATIKAGTGYTDSVIVEMDTDSVLENLTFDGTNMPNPSGAWAGTGTPVGSCVSVPGTSGAPRYRARIERCRFNNFPSGPLYASYCHDLVVSGCKAKTVQTYTANETNAAFEAYECDRVLYEGCSVDTFNWKGFNIGNSDGSEMVACHANGGVAGHASHYMSGATNCAIIGGTQTGGFGIKLFNCQNIVVSPFVSYSSSGSGIYVQACQDVIISGCTIRQPTAKGILVESLNGTGNVQRVTVKGCTVDYPTAATTSNQVGIYVSAGTTTTADDILISDCIVRRAYWGVQAPNTASAAVNRLTIQGCIFDSCVQYEVIAYAATVAIVGNEFYLDAAFPAIYVANATSTTGNRLTIRGNRSQNANSGGGHIEINTSTGISRWNVVDISGNTGMGGDKLAVVDFDNASADYCDVFILNDNTGWDQAAASAVDITFNSTNLVHATHINRNTLTTTSGALRNIALTNTSLLTNMVADGNIVNSITNRPRTAYPLEGTGSPENVVTAPVGRLYTRRDGGTGSTLYVKESGTSVTGWAPK